MKEAKFNPNGENLWVKIDMEGIYFITYIYQLWGANDDPHAVLTNPLKVNSNEVSNDDFYMIINDFSNAEPIAMFHRRTVEVTFDIHKTKDDNGYKLTATILLGKTIDSATPLANDSKAGKVKTGTVKTEKILIRLIDKNKQQ